MAPLTLVRHKEYTNRFSRIFIYVDGKKAGYVSNGKSRTLHLPVGKHAVYAQLSYFKTRPKELNLQVGDHPHFLIGSPYKHNRLTMLASSLSLLFLLGGLFLSRWLHQEVYLLGGLSLGALCILLEILFAREHSMLYYMSRGRNDYIFLQEMHVPAGNKPSIS